MSQDRPARSQDLPAVVVFYSTAPSSIEAIEILSGFLNDDEQQRAQRFSFATGRRLFITAHALLHYSLSRLGHGPPRRFRASRHGKPELVALEEEASLRFNLSHSGDLAACAVSRSFDVGIDVEVVGEFRFDGIVSSYFAPFEQALLANLLPDEKADRFYQLWTLKEAVVKAIGGGRSLPLSDVAIGFDPLALQEAFARLDDPRAWHIEQRRLSPRHWGGLAVRCGPGLGLSVAWQAISTDEIIALLRAEHGS